MLDQAARGVCRRLVERWMSKDGRPVREPLQAWVKERWEHLGLAQIHLIARFQRSCAHDLQQAPEDLFAAIAASVLPPPGPRPIDAEVTVRPAAVCEALTRLEQLLGVPEECRLGDGPDSPSQEPGQLERALADTASTMRDEYEQKLAEVAVRLIEDPHYRLAGAEEALRQLSAQVEEALQLHEDLARELQQRAVAAYQRLQDLLSSPTALLHSTPSRRAGFLRRTPTQPGPAVEVLELLRNYPKWRYQSLVLERVNALYLSLRGQLSDQLREVDYCRARLTELLGLLTPTEANGQRGAPVAGRCLLPSGCRSLDEAVRRLDKAVGPEQLVALDRRVQLVIRKQCRALVRVCLASATVLRGLLPLLLQEARTFLEPHLDASDVTKLYLEQHEAAEGQDCLTSDTLRQDLRALFEKAAPAPCLSQARETVLLGVPAGAAGQEFCALAREALAIPNAEKVATDDEIILYREQNHLTLADLEQLGPVGQEAYRKVFTQEYLTPHSRTDITDW